MEDNHESMWAVFQYINKLGFSKDELTAIVANTLVNIGEGDKKKAEVYLNYVRKEFDKTPFEVMNDVH